MAQDRPQLKLEDLQDLNHLELIAKQVVEGFIIGLHKSPFHGFSVEFAEHRLYNPGESIRHIDWKVYGRTDRLFVKRFEEETNLRCQLVIDCSSSMYYPYEKGVVNKLNFSIVAAAALINLLRKQRDAFGLSLFSDEVMRHTHARSNQVHQKLLLSYLEEVLNNPVLNRKTDAAKCLHEIAENTHKRSLLILFSDMFEDLRENGDEGKLDELFAALQHLRHNKHEVLLFHVTDARHEMDFEFENRPHVFVDMESGEEVRVHPSKVKDYYKEQLQKFHKLLKLRCGQYRIDMIDTDINKDFRQVLQQYLLKRTKLV